jgi:hypothetical protein
LKNLSHSAPPEAFGKTQFENRQSGDWRSQGRKHFVSLRQALNVIAAIRIGPKNPRFRKNKTWGTRRALQPNPHDWYLRRSVLVAQTFSVCAV